jgi:hypothetical protein
MINPEGMVRTQPGFDRPLNPAGDFDDHFPPSRTETLSNLPISRRSLAESKMISFYFRAPGDRLDAHLNISFMAEMAE